MAERLIDDNSVIDVIDDNGILDFTDEVGNYTLTGSSTVSTTTALISSLNPSTFGTSVTFTATVTPSLGGPATGIVTFYDLVTSLGTGALSSGVATLATSALSSGTHNITAVYGGDISFDSSTSSVLTQTVNPEGGSPILMPQICM